MSIRKPIAIVTAGAIASGWGAARAYEFGGSAWSQKPGIVLGAAAVAPPTGVYMFDQTFTYQSKIVGPYASNNVGVHAGVAATGLLWVPGWTFLGATYDAVVVTPFMGLAIDQPIGVAPVGMLNTFIAPVELNWKFGDNGFFAKAGLGMYVPDGTIQGPSGLDNVGAPWWTFQPNVVLSYFKNGWNLTANLYDEIHTRNSITGYRSGDVLHAEFTATKTMGNWTVGPVAYYVGQVSNDTSSAFYNNAINVNRYNIVAAGGMVGYNFGPASLNLWALQEFSANASGGTSGPSGADSATITKGFSIFASLSYRIWAPEEPQLSKIPNFHK